MWILFCLLLLVALAVLVLFTPIRITVDTFREEISARWGIVSASVTAHSGEFRYRLSAPFFQREGALDELLFDRRKPAERDEHPERRRGSSQRGRMPSLKRILGSFRVKRFCWHLDTGDPLWNAWLFPVFHLWHLRGHDVHISFTGESGLVLTITNNSYRLLKAVLVNQQPTTKNPAT